MKAQARNSIGFKGKDNGVAYGWLMVYMLFILPFLSTVFSEKEITIYYYLTAVAIVVTPVLNNIFPMGLPKIMYLCPMGAGERKRYLVTAYVFKVSISVMVIAITQIILLGVEIIPLYSALGMIFSITMVALGMNMAGSERVFQASDKQDKALRERCHGYFGRLGIQLIYSLCYMLIFFMGRDFDFQPMGRWETFFWIIGAVINLLLTILVLTNFKGAIEVVMNYEVSYKGGKADENSHTV